MNSVQNLEQFGRIYVKDLNKQKILNNCKNKRENWSLRRKFKKKDRRNLKNQTTNKFFKKAFVLKHTYLFI